MNRDFRVDRGENKVGFTRVVAGDWRWDVIPAPLVVWLREHGKSPEALVSPPAQRVVRNPPKETTDVFRLPGVEPTAALYVKRYLAPSVWLKIKTLFRDSKARRAFRYALILERLDIPTADAVAVGEFRRLMLRDSFLLTREVTDAITWFELDRRHPTGAHRIPLFRALGRYFGRLHNAGFCYSDANRNNLLVQFPPGGSPKLYLIDLDGLVRRPWITRPRAVEDLRRLSTRGPAARREQLWFLLEYCRARSGLFTPRQLLRKLRAGITKSCITVRTDSGKWFVRTTPMDDLMRQVLEQPDAFLADPASHFKNSRNVTVTRIRRLRNPGWVLRYLKYGKLVHRLRDFFRHSRARRALRMGLLLEHADVASARVLAAGEKRSLGWPLRAYLLTEEIPHAVTLASLIAQGHRQLRPALGRLGVELAKLHNAGFSHRDLKMTNVLFDDQLRPYLIDLDGVRRVRFASRLRAVADLARLARDASLDSAISARFAVDFLKTYCRARKRNDWRWWWREIEKRIR